MYTDLPEGFKVIEDTGSEPVSTELPKGFSLIDEPKASKPRSTVLNPVQEKNPFATANQPISTEPQLDLVNQRIIQPNLDSDTMQAQEATNVIAKYNNMINDDNFVLYAAKCYDAIHHNNTEEFFDDLKRFKYIKRLFSKYDAGGELKERLILNHIVILYNSFGEHTTKMLFFYLLSVLTRMLNTTNIKHINKRGEM